MTSRNDPIVKEVRAIREQIFAEHGATVEGLLST